MEVDTAVNMSGRGMQYVGNNREARREKIQGYNFIRMCGMSALVNVRDYY